MIPDDLDHVLKNHNNYYAALRITRTATREEITTSYRRMALKCHPDKVHESKRDKAHKAFQVLENAKKTLSDDTTRRVYDARGVEGVLHHESGGGGGGGRGGGGQGMYRRQPAPEDIFEHFFGFAGQQQRPGGRHRHPQQQGQPMEINPALLLLPVILFLLLAMFLQSSLEGSSSRGNGFGGRGTSRQNIEQQFSIIYDDRQGYVVHRSTKLYHAYDIVLDYYVSNAWHSMAEDGRIDLRRVEAAVLTAWRDTYGRQCEAETLRRRSRADYSTPPKCLEYDKVRRLLRS